MRHQGPSALDRDVHTLDGEIVQILAYTLFADVDEDNDPDCSVINTVPTCVMLYTVQYGESRLMRPEPSVYIIQSQSAAYE